MKNRHEEGMSDYEIQRRDKDRGHGGMLLLCDGSDLRSRPQGCQCP